MKQENAYKLKNELPSFTSPRYKKMHIDSDVRSHNSLKPHWKVGVRSSEQHEANCGSRCKYICTE